MWRDSADGWRSVAITHHVTTHIHNVQAVVLARCVYSNHSERSATRGEVACGVFEPLRCAVCAAVREVSRAPATAHNYYNRPTM